MTEQDAMLQKLFQAFADRDYKKCFEVGSGVVFTVANLAAWQVYLISLLRSGPSYVPLAPAMGSKLLEATQGTNPWWHTLLRFTVGQVDASAVLREAKDPTQRCQAQYYIGARLLTENKKDAARKELEACVNTKAPCQEYELARADLQELGVVTQALSAQTSEGERKPGLLARLFGRGKTEQPAQTQESASSQPQISHLSVTKEQFELMKKAAAGGNSVDAAALPGDLKQILQLAKQHGTATFISPGELKDPKKRAEIERALRQAANPSPEATAAGEQLKEILQGARVPGATVTVPKGETARRWYYRQEGGSSYGPVTDAELKNLISRGVVKPSSSLSLDGKSWTSATRVKGIKWA